MTLRWSSPIISQPWLQGFQRTTSTSSRGCLFIKVVQVESEPVRQWIENSLNVLVGQKQQKAQLPRAHIHSYICSLRALKLGLIITLELLLYWHQLNLNKLNQSIRQYFISGQLSPHIPSTEHNKVQNIYHSVYSSWQTYKCIHSSHNMLYNLLL